MTFYHRITEGIRITVRPAFAPEQSSPEEGRFVFTYAVRIENVSGLAAQLTHRIWRIHDSVGGGEEHEVQGEGVIGKQPTVEPGGVHEYESFCILKSPRGSMEGAYRFEREDGSSFAAQVPKFQLDAGAVTGY